MLRTLPFLVLLSIGCGTAAPDPGGEPPQASLTAVQTLRHHHADLDLDHVGLHAEARELPSPAAYQRRRPDFTTCSGEDVPITGAQTDVPRLDALEHAEACAR